MALTLIRMKTTRRGLAAYAPKVRGARREFFVETSQRLSAGQKVELVLYFADAPHSFSLHATVTMVRRKAASEELPAGASVEIEPAHHQRLDRALELAAGEDVPWFPRQHRRVSRALPIVLDGRTGRVKGWTLDVSLGGAAIVPEQQGPPAVGDDVAVCLWSEERDRQLTLEGHIVWRAPAADSVVCAGVEFVWGRVLWEYKVRRFFKRVAPEVLTVAA